MKIRTREKTTKIIIRTPKRMNGNFSVSDLRIGDTFKHDGVESTIHAIRETEKMTIFSVDSGKYERRFWKDGRVTIDATQYDAERL